MARKKNQSNDEFRRRLSELQTLYGSQKAAAEKLGVSTSTYRSYRSGKSTPRNKEVYSKVNRLRGRNVKKIESEELQEKREKREAKEQEQREKREAAAESKVNIESTRTWLYNQWNGLASYIKEKVLSISPYAAYEGSDSYSVQFWDGMTGFGKPASIQNASRIRVWAVYNLVASGDKVIDNPNIPFEIYGTKFPITTGVGQEWGIRKTNEYIADKLGAVQLVLGRKRYDLVAYLGYQLL